MSWETTSLVINILLLLWVGALKWQVSRLEARSRCWQRAYERLAKQFTDGKDRDNGHV